MRTTRYAVTKTGKNSDACSAGPNRSVQALVAVRPGARAAYSFAAKPVNSIGFAAMQQQWMGESTNSPKPLAPPADLRFNLNKIS
jgi:hypothetical protein